MTDVEYQDILVLQLHAMETLLWPMRHDSKAKQERERLRLNSVSLVFAPAKRDPGIAVDKNRNGCLGRGMAETIIGTLICLRRIQCRNNV